MNEFDRIDRLRAVLPCHEGRFGIGDDAAILHAAGAVTTDTMVEGVHFNRAWSDWSDVGYKLVASNVSDVLAMGAVAETCLLNFALPDAMGALDFDDLLAGVREGIESWGPTLKVGGGDTTSVGDGQAVLTMTIMGRPFAKRYWFRDGARAGHRLWVDGPVGLASAGLMLLKEGAATVLSEAEQECIQAHRRPKPPDWIRFGAPLLCEPNAAIDVSDGLAADIGHILKRSSVGGARLFAELPGWDILRTVFDSKVALTHQLSGGDDYVRVASGSTCPGDHWSEIGVLTDEHAGVRFVDASGAERSWNQSAGYQHFSDEE